MCVINTVVPVFARSDAVRTLLLLDVLVHEDPLNCCCVTCAITPCSSSSRSLNISHPLGTMLYLEQEPLEAGADGAFDLGDPSPPPSPPRSRVKVGVKCADDGVESADDRVESADVDVKSGDDGRPKTDTPMAPAADSPPPPSREIEDDWEKIDVQQDAGGEQPLVSPGKSTDGAVDDFKDAVETLRPDVERTESSGGAESATGHSSTTPLQADTSGVTCGESAAIVDGSGLQPVEAAAAATAAGKTSYIATGLSNVRLPMVYKRSRARSRSEGGEDSDGEEDFHDAYASATDLVKDAGKAREMKAAGNE